MRSRDYSVLTVLLMLVFVFSLTMPLQADAKNTNSNEGLKHRVDGLEEDVSTLRDHIDEEIDARIDGDDDLQDQINDLNDTVDSIHCPIAFATVDADGTIIHGTSNVVGVTWDENTKLYLVEFEEGGFYYRFNTVIATLLGGFSVSNPLPGRHIATSSRAGAYLIVSISDVNGDRGQHPFQFVVYRAPED